MALPPLITPEPWSVGLPPPVASAGADLLSGGGSLLTRFPGVTAAGLSPALAVTAIPFTAGLGNDLANKIGGDKDSWWHDTLEGAGTGAGVGLPIGLAGGPFAPISVTAGVLGGGLIGAAGGLAGHFLDGWFGGDDKKKEPAVTIETAQSKLDNALTTAQLPPELADQIRRVYATNLAFAPEEYAVTNAKGEQEVRKNESEDDKAAWALAQVQPMILNAVLSAPMQQQQAANTFALQQQAAQLFDPLAENVMANSAAYAAAVNPLIASLPADLQPLFKMQVAQQAAGASRLADAYKAQAMIGPQVEAMTNYQNQINSLSSQLLQQGIQNAMTPPAQSTDLASLLAGAGIGG